MALDIHFVEIAETAMGVVLRLFFGLAYLNLKFHSHYYLKGVRSVQLVVPLTEVHLVIFSFQLY